MANPEEPYKGWNRLSLVARLNYVDGEVDAMKREIEHLYHELRLVKVRKEARLLTTIEAATHLNISNEYLNKLCRTGRGPVSFRPNSSGSRMFSLDEINKWLRATAK